METQLLIHTVQKQQADLSEVSLAETLVLRESLKGSVGGLSDLSVFSRSMAEHQFKIKGRVVRI